MTPEISQVAIKQMYPKHTELEMWMWRSTVSQLDAKIQSYNQTSYKSHLAHCTYIFHLFWYLNEVLVDIVTLVPKHM